MNEFLTEIALEGKKLTGKHIYTAKQDFKRLDVFLAEETGLTRSYIKQLIDSGAVLLNGFKVKAGHGLKTGDTAELEIKETVSDIVAMDIPLDVLYEDGCMAVVNKPQGLSVHPGAGQRSGTLVNALMFRFGALSSINGVIRPGIVHRLDKDTSGAIVIAKNDRAHLSLSGQFASRSAEKVYLAVLEGRVKDDSGRIEEKIARSDRDRTMMAVSPEGREAVSYYKVIKRFKDASLIEFNILTGRTHQIRVHAKAIGHPVIGDKKYGYKKQRFSFLEGQLLHAHRLTLSHPVTSEKMSFTAPLPPHFSKALSILENMEKKE